MKKKKQAKDKKQIIEIHIYLHEEKNEEKQNISYTYYTPHYIAEDGCYVSL